MVWGEVEWGRRKERRAGGGELVQELWDVKVRRDAEVRVLMWLKLNLEEFFDRGC